jgi:hypothetical protein
MTRTMTMSGETRRAAAHAEARCEMPSVPNADGEPGLEAAPEPETPADTAGTASDLSARDQALLAFERRWWKHAGAKEEAIRSEFGFSAARYYQILGALLDSPLALAHDPMLIKRLQRMREARAEARARRSVISPRKN